MGSRPLLILFLAMPLSCGGGADDRALSPVQPATGAAPSPVPEIPSPAPTPAPGSELEPAPSPSPTCIHGSDHGIDRVSLVVYFVECGGGPLPGSGGATEAPVGCRLHLNATPRDGMGAPTCSRTWPEWQINDPNMVRGGGGDTFTPTYTLQRSGRFAARCIVDNVRSNWVNVDVFDR